MLTYFCWHCYGQSRQASGPCEHCKREIAPPEATSFEDRLIWALSHPLAERRMIAIRAIGRRRILRAREGLLALVSQSDPYLAAAALEALVALDGAELHRQLIERLRRSGGAPVKAAARELWSRRHEESGAPT